MFVGYTTLSGLLQELKPEDLIYVGLVEESQRAQVGSWLIAAIISSPVFLEKGELVRYCAMPLGNAVCYGGEPLAEERERLTRRAESGLAAIKVLLEKQGLVYHAAVVSMPSNLRIMHGETDLLHYDKETDTFHVK